MRMAADLNRKRTEESLDKTLKREAAIRYGRHTHTHTQRERYRQTKGARPACF
jgi:hypothetical protein